MNGVLFFQYFIVGIIVVSGLFLGKILTLIAPEEIRSSKKNLIILKKCLFVTFLFGSIILINILVIQVFVVLLLFYYIYDIIRYKIRDKNNYYLLYTALGLFLGLIAWKYIIYLAFIAFLIGLPTAILNHKRKIHVFVKIGIAFFVYYIASFLVYNYFLI